MKIDDYLRRAVVALELVIDDPETMDPLHKNAVNIALSYVLSVQHARASKADSPGAEPARVDGDPKF
jgi:hypothetical protein